MAPIEPNTVLGTVLNFWMDIAGQSSLVWRHHHNFDHHQVTCSPDDAEKNQPNPLCDCTLLIKAIPYPNINIDCILCISPYLVWHPILQTLASFYNFIDKAASRPMILLALSLGKLGYLMIFFILPMQRFGVREGALYTLLIHIITGSYTTLCLVANHFNESCESYDAPNGQSWTELQLRCSTNVILPNPKLNTILSIACGGLNYQKEHHLFPRALPLQLPGIAKILKPLCEKHGVAYGSCYASVSAVAFSFARQLQKVSGNEDNAKTTTARPKQL